MRLWIVISPGVGETFCRIELSYHSITQQFAEHFHEVTAFHPLRAAIMARKGNQPIHHRYIIHIIHHQCFPDLLPSPSTFLASTQSANIHDSPPAKSRTIAVRLISMALTGYYRTLRRPRAHKPLSMLKYDPVGTCGHSSACHGNLNRGLFAGEGVEELRNCADIWAVKRHVLFLEQKRGGGK